MSSGEPCGRAWLRTLRRFLADERGVSLVETLTGLVILGTVLATLTGLFVSASKAELDMNQRFRAQQDARLALDALRRELHCAKTITTASGTWPSSSMTLTLPTDAYGARICPTGVGAVTWCAIGSGSRFGLWRTPGTSCTTTGGRQRADYLIPSPASTTPLLFNFFPQEPARLARLGVTISVDTNPADKVRAYTLQDGIALRNSRRAAP